MCPRQLEHCIGASAKALVPTLFRRLALERCCDARANRLTWLLANNLPSRDHLVGRMPEISLKQLALAPGIELQAAVNAFAGQRVPFDECGFSDFD